MTTVVSSDDQSGLKPYHVIPPEQIEALLAEHIEEVRPAIAELDRQQVRVVSEERDG
jgi:hypothetical protein